MPRFVSLITDQGPHLVNPDQVQYLAPSRADTADRRVTRLVFGIATGGFHELHVVGDKDAVRRALEGDESALAPAAAP